MSALKNDRFIKAIWKQTTDCTPIWIMRQAGRYLPEYRATREQAGSFLNLCKTPELACEVTLQPLRRYDLDASIIFSDILTIPDGLGLGLQLIEGVGPKFNHPLRRSRDIELLSPLDVAKVSYVYDAIRLVQHELAGKVPLIGFAGSPWTLATYMVEGKSGSEFKLIEAMRQEHPQLLHKLLDILAQSVSAHLNGQIAAGVQAVMIFDTWGGLLNKQNYIEFSLAYIKQIVSQLTRVYNGNKVPLIIFSRDCNDRLEELAEAGGDMLGVDWGITLQDARTRVGRKVALQGNLNPAYLLEDPDTIRKEAMRIIDSFGHGSGHVFNLGHGITPDVPPEHVSVLIEAVHELSQPYHKRQLQ